MTTPFVVAIVGEKAAGKGTAAVILRDEFGAAVLRFSDPIRVIDCAQRSTGYPLRNPRDVARRLAIILEDAKPHDGADIFSDALYNRYGIAAPYVSLLQHIGNTWREVWGSDVFTEILLDVGALTQPSLLVLDGVRNPGEIAPLHKRCAGRHALLAIRADIGVRRRRFLERRRRAGDPTTAEEFLRLDRRDRGEGEPPDGQQVQRCIECVPRENVIWNDHDDIRPLKIVIRAWAQRILPAEITKKE